VKIEQSDGQAVLFGPAPQSLTGEAQWGVERTFTRAHRDELIDSREADKRLEREVSFDPDLWIIEVENSPREAWLDIAG
jgi:hypothetical protein